MLLAAAILANLVEATTNGNMSSRANHAPLERSATSGRMDP